MYNTPELCLVGAASNLVLDTSVPDLKNDLGFCSDQQSDVSQPETLAFIDEEAW